MLADATGRADRDSGPDGMGGGVIDGPEHRRHRARPVGEGEAQERRSVALSSRLDLADEQDRVDVASVAPLAQERLGRNLGTDSRHALSVASRRLV
jgi:hypothetical protein